MKRIFLFILTNLAVVFAVTLIFTLTCRLLGISTSTFAADGLNYTTLAVYSLVFGMTGSVISLLLSKPIAKFSTGAKTITGSEGASEAWLVSTVQDLSARAGIKMPEVAIYEGEPNAFATGAFKDASLVAVSTGIMRSMTKNELRAVLGHEISHVSNGDMVTMTLVQGVLNAVVIFMSRVLAFFLDRAVSGKDSRRFGYGPLGAISYYILQFVLGIIASIVVCSYSRHREFAADSGSANLLGSPQDMIAALRRLGNLTPGVLPDSLKAFGISGEKFRNLFSTHPSLEKRIEALQNLTYRQM